MPELPEVETTLAGILPYLKQQTILRVIIRHWHLRWPIPRNIENLLKNQLVTGITRRGKYLLFHTSIGTIILHLGMSGSVRIITTNTPPKKHDHIDIELSNQMVLRYTDPRRFGAFLWTTEPPEEHPLLRELGPEPLGKNFTSRYLQQRAKGRKVPIKSLIMNSKIVVGVGNIYATEALFAANINPNTLAKDLPLTAFTRLTTEIKKILRAAIKQGGTTLKDFSQSDGKPGYFKFHLKAYGRKNLPCVRCKTILIECRLGQRSTVYCPTCQDIY